jgi:Ca-activated chloride channel family protein
VRVNLNERLPMKRALSAALALMMSCSMMYAERSAPEPTPPPDHSPPPSENARLNYKRTSPYNFDDDTIEGELTKPDGDKRNAPARDPNVLDGHGGKYDKKTGGDRDRDGIADNTRLLKPADAVTVTTGTEKKPDEDRGGRKANDEGRAETGETLLQHYGVNPTVDTAADPVSTFAADVDTGSYTLSRAYLERGQLPPEAAVRVEEFVNAFDYGYRAPEREAFAVQVEAFPSPYRKGYHVLHVGLKGREVTAEARKSANLVFVIDVSGSMSAENRLPMAKRALSMLTNQLRPDDTVAIVVYGDNARTVLPPTPASEKERIHAALHGLVSEGSTNVQAGLELGYTVALRGFKGSGINRIILCSDGVANNGITTADGIFAKVKGKASEGITLTTVGFGMGSYNDVLMERLADMGDGHYAYVDKLDEAKRIFVEQLTGTLEVIAKDVKLQLEFNPEAVERYRLLGFENRALRREDFANDRVDAGELGAGHAVTAVYEMKLKSRAPKFFATFRARYKQPRGGESALVEKALPTEVVRDSVNASSGPTRLSLVAAGFAEKLRGSYWARNLSWDELLATWDSLPGALKDREQSQELHRLILTAKRLDHRPDRFEHEVPLAQMDFDRIPVLR